MKITNTLSFFSLIVILWGCEKTDFNVSGILKSDGKVLENASVNIDGLEQYKTTTGSDGYFSIKNVYTGSHVLNTYKSSDDDSYIKKSYDIVITNNDLAFDTLLLPNPVIIETIILDSINNIATIKWNKSTAEDFREYKLYSHSSSGLDETTGTLEHVTIDRNDTIKSVQLENLSEKYFRVFVLNEYGQLGGSNIEKIASINRNIVKGGYFDTTEDLSYWTLSGNISIDQVNIHTGTGSALLYSEIDTAGNSISGSIDRWPVAENEISINIELEGDRDYTISFWYRLSGLGYMMYPFNFYYHQNNEGKLYTTIYDYNWKGDWILDSPFKILDDTGWLLFKDTFYSDSDSYAVFHITTQVEKVWIDNFEIKIAE